MKIEDRRKESEKEVARIGDMIITNSNARYLLLSSNQINEEYPIAVYNLDDNRIDFLTCQSVFCIGGSLMSETIVEIIPKNNLKLVIE